MNYIEITYTKRELQKLSSLVDTLFAYAYLYDKKIKEVSSLTSKSTELVDTGLQEKERYPFIERVFLDEGKKFAYVTEAGYLSIASVEVDSGGEYIPSYIGGVIPHFYGESVWEMIKKVRNLHKDDSPITVDTYQMDRNEFFYYVKRAIQEAERDYYLASDKLDQIIEASSLYRGVPTDTKSNPFHYIENATYEEITNALILNQL